jgi:DNA topoisomerase-1
MSTLEGRNYCSLENGKYKAEPLGEAIVDQLNPYFPNIMDVQFTAKMESNLDEIANGKKEWISVLREFYDPYRKMFIEAESSMPKITVQRITGESCPECESPLAEKIGRNGKFIACTAFPDCRFSKPFIIKTGAVCPMCSGDILQRQGGKRRTVFYGCSNYPNCDFSMRQKPLPVKCPECSGVLIESAKNTGTCVNCKYKGQIPNEKAKDTGVVV